MTLIIILSAVFAAILFILIPKRVSFSARIRKQLVSVRLVPRLFFGLIPIKIDIRLVLRHPDGLKVLFGNKEAKHVKIKKGRKNANYFKALRFEKLIVTGTLGIKDGPDITVLLTGLIEMALIEASLGFFKLKPEVMLEPTFVKNVFAVNINGIAFVNAGRLILEIMTHKKEKKNESSYRKHNAVVHGAHKEAC